MRAMLRCIIIIVVALTILLLFGILSVSIFGSASTPKVLNIAVIGAGPAGLSSAKNALEQGHNVVIYDKGEAIGGTWWYTDKTGTDEYGVFIHSAMYYKVRTNIPHQTMELPLHKYPNGTPSYLSHENVWQYLNTYADRFDLKKHVKLHHLVENVHSIENNKWNITVLDLPNNKIESVIYDAVFVCINRLSSPNYPQIEGADQFKGKIMHSHDYRRAEQFRGADVLVFGNGASAPEIVLQVSKTANYVTWSNPEFEEPTAEARKVYGQNVTFTNNVKHLIKNGAEFMDGTYRNFTVVICVTGFNYSYPFLDSDAGIYVDENYVQPLYKQILNIEHPTMALIGVPDFAFYYRVYDLQARFALKFFSGAKELPPKLEMLKDMQDYAETQSKKGHPKSEIHRVESEDCKEYYDQVAQAADIEKIPDVYPKILVDSIESREKEPFGFRKNKYIIIDDKTFRKEREV
ncbi:senecionine N-oxygenase-like [Contarinia nasturtii]|uniref:senecionine N-oxygenase-like n=1 Tax=Contarinia nasturtii TaxID=265458 RepID=UPI0012D3FFB3|nr:senecionine N-oxygenase-like [Contarinia nasturtii]